jgi:MFS family permease
VGGARARTGVFLIGLAAAWNGGNVGPVVAPLADEFDASLSEIGLLSGTFFFAGIVVASAASSALARRIPVAAGLRACCALCLAGNVIFAASPVFGGLIVGRVVAGLGLGLCFLFGAAYARAAGGVRLLGVFGAGITIGIAAALGLGSLLEDAGVDWRVGFAISAALGLAPLPFLPTRVEVERPKEEPRQGLLREALTSIRWWRLELLGITVLTVPLVVGAWLVQYLSAGDGIGVAAAGGLYFMLFDVGGRLSAAGVSSVALAVGGLVAAAAGLAILAEDRSVLPALASVVLMGVGFSLPYPLFYDEGESVLPDRPLAGLALLQVGANAFPIPVIPLVGAALADGHAEEAFLALAALVVVAAVANLRPAAPEPAT